ncbi:helix-turn-helix transcriptional regulator [Micromonospora sp. NPDC047557]|uniref:helix-turn-helix transcriptional regulator n=1 Tax=Micromonospora sp. NPDC047557 TaxID=3364250 RepID=UPI00371B2B25
MQTTSTPGVSVEPRFLLLSDVAAELNVSDSQVYHMVRSGELPAIKIGGRGQWRVERARLEEYIAQKYAETADWVRGNPLIDRDPE